VAALAAATGGGQGSADHKTAPPTNVLHLARAGRATPHWALSRREQFLDGHSDRWIEEKDERIAAGAEIPRRLLVDLGGDDGQHQGDK